MADRVEIRVSAMTEDAARKLEGLQKKVEGMRGAGGQVRMPGLASFAGEADASAAATEKFRETLHVLHPVLEEAGLGLSNLRALSAASRVGIVGLGAALAGAAAVGLAKMGDEAKRVNEQLGALNLPSEQIRKHAAEMGQSYENYAGALEKIQKAQQLYGGPGAIRYAPGAPGAVSPFAKQAEGALDTLLGFGKLHAMVPSEAAKMADEFFDSFKKQGEQNRPQILTPEQIVRLPEPVQNELARALGRGQTGTDLLRTIQAGAGIPLQEVLRDLARQAPEVQRRSQALPPEKGLLTGTAEEFGNRLKSEAAPAAEQTSTFLTRWLQNLLGKPQAAPRSALEAAGYGAATLGTAGLGAGALYGTPAFGFTGFFAPLFGALAGAGIGALGGAGLGALAYGLGAFPGQQQPATFAERFEAAPTSALVDAAEPLKAAGVQLSEAAQQLQAAASKQTGGGGPEGKAGGGMIIGPGTGTSDDVPIMASNREFVMTEKATEGNEGFLQAMNATEGDLGEALRRFGYGRQEGGFTSPGSVGAAIAGGFGSSVPGMGLFPPDEFELPRLGYAGAGASGFAKAFAEQAGYLSAMLATPNFGVTPGFGIPAGDIFANTPHYAAGGEIGGGAESSIGDSTPPPAREVHLTIDIPGHGSFGPVRGDEEVVAAMERSAIWKKRTQIKPYQTGVT